MSDAPSPSRGEGRGERSAPSAGERALIVTADDFGADVSVNDAVEQGHRDGILTCASLMVGGAAAADAVARARRLPRLGVGLHLVLVDGRPVLPAATVPDLVDREGHFRANMALAGVNFLRPAVRRQLAAEIAAQFAAFAASGLALDHVNAHKHFHLHPMIAALILAIGRRHGLRAARAPVEPRAVLARIEAVAPPALADRIAAPWARRVRARFRAAALTVPDQVFGLAWTGQLDAARLAGLIRHLPPGLSEIYLHPALADDHPGHVPGYRYRAECAALTDGDVRSAIGAEGVRLGRFADFTRGGAEAGG